MELHPLGEDGAVSLWDLATHKRLATRRVARTNSALCLTPDGTAVAFGEGPRLVLTNAAGVVRSFKSETIDLLFTADDRYAVILDRSKVTCWDLAPHAAASDLLTGDQGSATRP